jgi:hypothetical protein
MYLALFRIASTASEEDKAEESDFLKSIRDEVEAYLKTLPEGEVAFSVVAEEMLRKTVQVL